MRAICVAVFVGISIALGCARPQRVDLMTMEPTCDTVPRPLTNRDQVGGKIPPAVAAPSEHGVIIGVVLEAGTRRALEGSTVRLYRNRPDTGRVQVGHDVWTNTSGAFALEPQAPAGYALVINRIGYAAQTQRVTLRAGVVDTVRIELAYKSCVGY